MKAASRSRSWTGPVCALGLALGLIWMFLRGSDAPRIDLGPYAVAGAVAAEECSEILRGRGEVVLVIPDPGPDRDPVMDAQVKAFREALKRVGQVQVRSVETVKMDPFQSMRTGGAMPAERLAALLDRSPGIAGLVFFIGFPALDSSAVADLKRRAIPCMVVSAALPGYDRWIEQGILRLAIVPRPRSADDRLAPARNLREAFEQQYLLLRHRAAPGADAAASRDGRPGR